MNREELERTIRQTKTARESWHWSLGKAEEMIDILSGELEELEAKLEELGVTNSKETK
ncbi:hypothetical protein ACR0ST_01785 [Aliidiomarina sp. Khilg15.8]